MKDLALLLLRIVAGGTLAAHGYTKLFGGPGKTAPQPLNQLLGQNFAKAVESTGPAGFAGMLESRGVPYPQYAAYASGLAEFGGGLALMTGAYTRLAALAVMLNMGVAIRRVHWETGFYGQGGYEFPLQLMTAAATLFLAGPGAISVDGLAAGTRKTAQAVGSGVGSVTGGTRRAAQTVGSGVGGAQGGLADRARRAAQAVGSALPVGPGTSRRN